MSHYKAVFCAAYLLLFASVISKAQSISGVVTSCAGRQPLAGVTVKIAGHSPVTATGTNGSYVLNNVKQGVYTLEFSFVGMKTVKKEVKIESNRQKTVNLCMEDASSELEEVVVEAKSPVQRIRESSFNVIAVNAEALHNTSLDISHALDRVSGVKIRETGGTGSNSHISLNGFSGRHVKIFWKVSARRSERQNHGDRFACTLRRQDVFPDYRRSSRSRYIYH